MKISEIITDKYKLRISPTVYYDLLADVQEYEKDQEPRCKECKWWKDSDGVYRRGCRAESICPINRKEVFEGNGYCYLFEQQESDVGDYADAIHDQFDNMTGSMNL